MLYQDPILCAVRDSGVFESRLNAFMLCAMLYAACDASMHLNTAYNADYDSHFAPVLQTLSLGRDAV